MDWAHAHYRGQIRFTVRCTGLTQNENGTCTLTMHLAISNAAECRLIGKELLEYGEHKDASAQIVKK